MTMKQIIDENEVRLGRLWSAIVAVLPEDEVRELIALKRAGKLTSEAVSAVLQKDGVRGKVLEVIGGWSAKGIGGKGE